MYVLLLSVLVISVCIVVAKGGFLGFSSGEEKSNVSSNLKAHDDNQNDFISGIDTNGKDGVSLLELKKYIKFIGGEQFDEIQEIARAAEQSYSQLNRDNDAYLSLSELRAGIQRQELRLATIEEFQLYLAHGVHLRSEDREKFRTHEIKGKDILGLGLTQNNCDLLVASNGLNITSIVDARRLCRSFASFLLQIVPAPVLLPGVRTITAGVNFTATSTSPARVRINWRSLPLPAPPLCPPSHTHVCPNHNHDVVYGEPEHAHDDFGGDGSSIGGCNHTCHSEPVPASRSGAEGDGVTKEYVLRRQVRREVEEAGDGKELGDTEEGDWDWEPWEVVWSGADRTEYVDRSVDADTEYRYQISAWNEGGRSDYLILQVRTQPLGWSAYLQRRFCALLESLRDTNPDQVGGYLGAVFVGFVLGVLVAKFTGARSAVPAGNASAVVGKHGHGRAVKHSRAPLVQNWAGEGGRIYCHIADAEHHSHSDEAMDTKNCFWCGVRVKVGYAMGIGVLQKYDCSNCARVFCAHCGYTEGDKKTHRCALCRAALGQRSNLPLRQPSVGRGRSSVLVRGASERSDISDDSSIASATSASVPAPPAAPAAADSSPSLTRVANAARGGTSALPSTPHARSSSPGYFPIDEHRPPRPPSKHLESLGKGIANSLGLRERHPSVDK